VFDLFRRRRPDAAIDARVEGGSRVYALGDLHGRADLLKTAFAAIDRDRRSSPLRVKIVPLGDYIDRGPASREVIDLLVRGVRGCEVIALRGNHEQMLLDFLDDPAGCGPVWMANGAAETLASYGVDTGGARRLPAMALEGIRDVLRERLPAAHERFLRTSRLSYVSGDYWFVHAGVRRGVALAEQAERDLLWIRGGFADRDEPGESVVVHGHTPVEEPTLGRYRINLDTGAVYSNRLTCLVLEGDQRRLLAI
jgi:serine/threonine protein phosphatase 1